MLVLLLLSEGEIQREMTKDLESIISSGNNPILHTDRPCQDIYMFILSLFHLLGIDDT